MARELKCYVAYRYLPPPFDAEVKQAGPHPDLSILDIVNSAFKVKIQGAWGA